MYPVVGRMDRAGRSELCRHGLGKPLPPSRSGFSELPGVKYGLTQGVEVPGFSFRGGTGFRGRVACRIPAGGTVMHCKQQESYHGGAGVYSSVDFTNEINIISEHAVSP